jgi:thymidylate kinase
MEEINLELRTPLGQIAPPVNGDPPSQIVNAHVSLSRNTGASGLIAELLRVLSEEGILYCHWKSNWKIENWLAGDDDLDLLVRRSDVPRFVASLSRLGFKRAILPPRKEIPGILNYYGYDKSSKSFVHVHAHYQLVLGHDATKNYRIPVERTLLETAVRDGRIPITSPELELALFVMRMILKYSVTEGTVRGWLRRSRRHADAIRDEIEFLRCRVDPVKFTDVFRRIFPMVDRELFDECLEALTNGAGTVKYHTLKRRLQKCLDAHSRSPRPVAELRRFSEYIRTILNTFALKKTPRKRFDTGGCLIAIVGGDGSGKSTSIKDLNKWLGKKFDTETIHLGIPPKSLSTWAVIGALRLRRMVLVQREFNAFQPEVNFLQELRWLCTARDRYRLYKKVRRFTSNGGIAICDRFPVEKLQLMDGPRIRRSLNGSGGLPVHRFLIGREEWYYRHILPPDLLVVLRADPMVAACRKINEPSTHVIPRAKELWEADWNGTSAHVINANRPLDDVLSDVRALVWGEL